VLTERQTFARIGGRERSHLLVQAIMSAIDESDGPTTLARIGVMRAIHRNQTDG
jgi:hypothetical protein